MTKPANDEIEKKLIQLLSIRGLCGQRQIEETLPFLKQLITSREKRVAEEIIASIEDWIVYRMDKDDEEYGACKDLLDYLRKKYLTEEPGKEGDG